MGRHVGMVCAGILLVAGAGCSGDSFLNSGSGAGSQNIVVNGTVPEVAMRLKEAITAAGITVKDKHVAEDLRLAGVTPKDKGFCLHLREDAHDGVKTLVSVHWDNGPDDEFWRTIVLPLAKAGPG